MAGSRGTADRLFEGRPESLRLFRVVETYIRSLGPVDVIALKTQIAFGVKRRFAWVWMPQMWIKAQPEKSIVLTIGLRRQLKNRRIKESNEPYPGRFVHHIVIRKASDLDPQVKAWLREAYELAQADHPRKA